jgi:hypothetical protein
MRRRDARKLVYELLAMEAQALRVPGRLQQLVDVADRDVPAVLNALLVAEARMRKKAKGYFVPLTPYADQLASRISEHARRADLPRAA